MPSVPQNFTATASSSSEVELSWDDPEYRNGKIIHYQLYYKQIADNSVSNIILCMLKFITIGAKCHHL